MKTESPVLRCETSHLVPGQVLHTVNTKLADNRLRQVTWPGLHTSERLFRCGSLQQLTICGHVVKAGLIAALSSRSGATRHYSR